MTVDLRFWNSIFRTKEQKKSNRLWETDNFHRDKSNLIFLVICQTRLISASPQTLWTNYLPTHITF